MTMCCRALPLYGKTTGCGLTAHAVVVPRRQSIRDHKPTGDVKLDDLTRKVDDILQGQEEAIESPE